MEAEEIRQPEESSLPATRELLTLREAAQRFGVQYWRLLTLVQEGKLPYETGVERYRRGTPGRLPAYYVQPEDVRRHLPEVSPITAEELERVPDLWVTLQMAARVSGLKRRQIKAFADRRLVPHGTTLAPEGNDSYVYVSLRGLAQYLGSDRSMTDFPMRRLNLEQLEQDLQAEESQLVTTIVQIRPSRPVRMRSRPRATPTVTERQRRDRPRQDEKKAGELPPQPAS